MGVPLSYFYPRAGELGRQQLQQRNGHVEKALTEVLAVQPRAWTLIETEARDASVSAPRLSRILNSRCVLMITPSKVRVRNTTLQMNISKPAHSN